MFGTSLAWMGAGIFGFEADFGFSPNFFENTTGSSNFQFGDSNLTTVMGNILLGVPIGGQHGVGFRPYAAGGVGLIKSRIGDAGDLFEVDSTNWGFDVGAGAIFFFSDRVGLRGDVRYFRSLQDDQPDDDFDVGSPTSASGAATAGVTHSLLNRHETIPADASAPPTAHPMARGRSHRGVGTTGEMTRRP